MNEIRAIAVTALVLLVAVSAMPIPTSAQANTEITSCQVINSSGTYQVTEDIDGSGTCIDIQTENDVTIEGNGYAITGDGSGTAIEGNPGTSVTVRNVEVSNWENGISPNSANLVVEDSVISSNTDGIEYANANVELVRTEVTGNEEWGVFMTAGYFQSTDGRISNNGDGAGFIDGDIAEMDGTTVSNNDDTGIYAGHYMSSQFNDVTVEDNGGDGVLLVAQGSQTTISDSRIVSNDGHGINGVDGEHEVTVTDTFIDNNRGSAIESTDGATIEASNVDLNGGVTFESYGVALSVSTGGSDYETDAVTLEGNDATFYFETSSDDAQLMEQTGNSWEQHSTYENTGGEFEATLGPGTYAGDSYQMATPAPTTQEPTDTPTETQTPVPTTQEQTDTPTDTETPVPTTQEQTSTPTDTETSTDEPAIIAPLDPEPTDTPTSTPTDTETSTPVSVEGSPTPTTTSTETSTTTSTETMNATNVDQSSEDEAGLGGDDGRWRWLAIAFAIILILGLAVAAFVNWEEYGSSEEVSELEDRRR